MNKSVKNQILISIAILALLAATNTFCGAYRTRPAAQGTYKPALSPRELARQKSALEQYKKAHAAAPKAAAPRAAARIPAPNNINYVRVPAQSGADCGYHALYNGCKHYYTLRGQRTIAFPLNAWRQQVIAQRGHNDGGAWIDYLEMMNLAHYSQIDPAIYSVIHDIHQFRLHPAHLEFYPNLINLPTIIAQLRNVEGASHAFIIGNMQHNRIGGRLASSRGHWVAIVAQRLNNQIVYHVLDSLNGRPQDKVQALINLIEQPTLESLIDTQQTAELITQVKQIHNRAQQHLADGHVNLDLALQELRNALLPIHQAQKMNDQFLAGRLLSIRGSIAEIESYAQDTDRYAARINELTSIIPPVAQLEQNAARVEALFNRAQPTRPVFAGPSSPRLRRTRPARLAEPVLREVEGPGYRPQPAVKKSALTRPAAPKITRAPAPKKPAIKSTSVKPNFSKPKPVAVYRPVVAPRYVPKPQTVKPVSKPVAHRPVRRPARTTKAPSKAPQGMLEKAKRTVAHWWKAVVY